MGGPARQDLPGPDRRGVERMTSVPTSLGRKFTYHPGAMSTSPPEAPPSIQPGGYQPARAEAPAAPAAGTQLPEYQAARRPGSAPDRSPLAYPMYDPPPEDFKLRLPWDLQKQLLTSVTPFEPVGPRPEPEVQGPEQYGPVAYSSPMAFRPVGPPQGPEQYGPTMTPPPRRELAAPSMLTSENMLSAFGREHVQPPEPWRRIQLEPPRRPLGPPLEPRPTEAMTYGAPQAGPPVPPGRFLEVLRGAPAGLRGAPSPPTPSPSILGVDPLQILQRRMGP
jgi:hypothetical protein